MNGQSSVNESVQLGHEEHQPAGQLNTPNIKALAAVLGVSRTTIYAWLEMPDSPGQDPAGGYDVGKWRAFARRIGSKTTAGESGNKLALQEEELRLKNEALRFNLDVKRGQYVTCEEVVRDFSETLGIAKATLYNIFERELPTFYTLDETANRRLNRDAMDRALLVIGEKIEQWKKRRDETKTINR